MNRRFIALSTVVLALIVSAVLLWTLNRSPQKSLITSHDEVQPRASVAQDPPPVVPPPALQPQAVKEAPPVGKFVPGHFPGVSVSHEPGTHRPTPPEGTPRTAPKEQEIILPDGRRLIGATLDETWRVPLRLNADP